MLAVFVSLVMVMLCAATVYEKGAEVVRMYHTLLGEQAFRRGMDIYFERHDGMAVTCDDFRLAMAEAATAEAWKHGHTDVVGPLLRGQFERWYSQDSTPEVTVRRRWASEGGAVGTLHVTLEQHCPHSLAQPTKLPMVVPVRMGLVAATADGGMQDMALQTHLSYADAAVVHGDIVVLTRKSHSLVFDHVHRGAVPSVLRGFSAPVRVKFEPEQSSNELALLMAHDTDCFNRYDAAQRLASKVRGFFYGHI